MLIRDLGTIDFNEALSIQLEYVKQRINGCNRDLLLVLEHYPVITLGRLGTLDPILDAEYFTKRKIPIIRTARGGDVTCHSPGQVLVYPIVSIRNLPGGIRGYIDSLENAVTLALRVLDIPAERKQGDRGVWVGGKKIAFSGISVKNGVTSHGIAVNVNNGLEMFDKIMPCGRSDIKVTSAREVTGRDMDMSEMKTLLGEYIKKTLIDARSEQYATNFSEAKGA